MNNNDLNEFFLSKYINVHYYLIWSIRPPIAIYMYLFLMFFNRKIKSIVFFFMNFMQKRKEQIKNKTLKI